MDDREMKLNFFYNKYLKKKYPMINKVVVKFEDFKNGTFYTEMGIFVSKSSDIRNYRDEILKTIDNTLPYVGIRFSRIYFSG
jgi:hypothetical protein